MYTKPLDRRTVTTLDVSEDIAILGRLLIAAAINQRFREKLLDNPEDAVRSGFGGERFHITEDTMKVIAAIHESTLPEFIRRLDSSLSNRLLISEPVRPPT